MDGGVLRAVWFESMFASALPERDAAELWRALLEEADESGLEAMASASLCVLLIRCREHLLRPEPDLEALFRQLSDTSVDATCRPIVHLATCLVDPRALPLSPSNSERGSRSERSQEPRIHPWRD